MVFLCIEVKYDVNFLKSLKQFKKESITLPTYIGSSEINELLSTLSSLNSFVYTQDKSSHLSVTEDVIHVACVVKS